MKKRVVYFVLVLLIGGLSSCGPRPYYQTREGKKKQDHYNRIQYGTEKKY